MNNLPIKYKLLIYGGLALLILAGVGIPFGIILKQNYNLKTQNARLSGQLDIAHENLTESLQRAETKIAETQDELNDFAEAYGLDISAIRTDLSKVGGRLEAVAITTGKTTTIVKNYHVSESSEPSKAEVPICENDGRPIDIHEYTKHIETTHLRDSNGMKIGSVSFEAAKEAPWQTRAYGITYKINNVIGETSDGRTILHTELQATSDAEPSKTFRIEGIDSRVLNAPVEPTSFNWWDPAIYLMATLGVNVYNEIGFSASLSVGFSVFSYGDLRFLGISAGYDAFRNSFRASLIPVLYNVGGPLPLIDDLWLFLDIGIDHRADVSVSFGIGTRL